MAKAGRGLAESQAGSKRLEGILSVILDLLKAQVPLSSPWKGEESKKLRGLVHGQNVHHQAK